MVLSHLCKLASTDRQTDRQTTLTLFQTDLESLYQPMVLSHLCKLASTDIQTDRQHLHYFKLIWGHYISQWYYHISVNWHQQTDRQTTLTLFQTDLGSLYQPIVQSHLCKLASTDIQTDR